MADERLKPHRVLYLSAYGIRDISLASMLWSCLQCMMLQIGKYLRAGNPRNGLTMQSLGTIGRVPKLNGIIGAGPDEP